MTADYEYDVAFSFHSLDEGLATQLNDLLQDRFKTFLYSKRQEVLAGSDGEETFNAVFGEKARCTVVFYRKEWGETPFTRIEQTAIRNRAFAEGYEFTIFIPTDDPPTTPPWLPRTRLYFGLSKFGLQGAAAVIEKRIQELGGEPTVESVQDRAARLQRAQDLKTARKRFHDSEEGVRQANDAFKVLTSTLQIRASEIASANPSLANLKVRKISGLLVGQRHPCMRRRLLGCAVSELARRIRPEGRHLHGRPAPAGADTRLGGAPAARQGRIRL